jgi:hypothetical protein
MNSYPKIYALGHRAIAALNGSQVVIEEKIDGSQFSFGRYNKILRVKSHTKEMVPDAPEKMFKKAVDFVASLDLQDGWTYRGEVLDKPHHNNLTYSRVPNGNVILFDINVRPEDYLSYNDKDIEAIRLSLEIVPRIYEGIFNFDIPTLMAFLERESILGGTKIEGIVVKSYNLFGPDGKPLMGKYVSEKFKEENKKNWRGNNPGGKDVIGKLIEVFKTEARWEKAILHLREEGKITDDPKDIGLIIKTVMQDIKDECNEEIKEMLYSWAIDNILRGCIRGFPEWYKKKLIEKD